MRSKGGGDGWEDGKRDPAGERGDGKGDPAGERGDGMGDPAGELGDGKGEEVSRPAFSFACVRAKAYP